MKLQLWAADVFRFAVTGTEPHRFLNRAAAAGVHLRRVRWQKDGCTATAGGADRRRLEQLAREGGWTLTVTARRGPGRRAEALLRTRLGLAVGAVLFFALLQLLGGFVWCIDFGAMDADLQPAMRALLADCHIQEGTRLTPPLLQAAQAQALRQSEVFGWISLNFTGGCLLIESTPAQSRTVQQTPPPQGLCAKADGKILAVETQSGFALVKVGDTVIRGQPLASAERLDRKGRAVVQGAAGRITARVEKQYTADQPLTAEAALYTGRSAEEVTLYLPGCTRTAAPAVPLEGERQTAWEPLRLGRLALPGCLRHVTTWEKTTGTLTYSEPTAAALALRRCREQLLQEFPDAEIEAEQREISASDGVARAAVAYIFTADIAEPQ